MSYVKDAVREVRVMAPLEQRKVLDVTGKHADTFRDHMVISLALGTALREGEIAALTVGCVASSAREVRRRWEIVTFARKGRKPPAKGKPAAPEPETQRVFPSKIVRRKLLKFLAWKKRRGEPVGATAPLFVAGASSTRDGDHPPLSARMLRKMFRTWQTRAGLTPPYFTFHELRHTALTTLFRRTKDIMLVKRAARHKSIMTTMIYAHVSDDELRKGLEDQPG